MSTSIEEAYKNEYTPEKLAFAIFNKPIQPPKSCQILLDHVDNEYIFELLLKTLSYGINVLYDNKINIEDVDKILINEYLASLGFKLNISIEDKKEDQHKLFFTDISNEQHYCQLKLNDFPDYFIEYTKKHSGHDKYEDKYRFILNGKNNEIERESLADYYSIYFNKSSTKKIKISFDFL